VKEIRLPTVNSGQSYIVSTGQGWGLKGSAWQNQNGKGFTGKSLLKKGVSPGRNIKERRKKGEETAKYPAA